MKYIPKDKISIYGIPLEDFLQSLKEQQFSLHQRAQLKFSILLDVEWHLFGHCLREQ